MQWRHDDVRITDDVDAVDLEVVHGVLREAYWSPGLPREVLDRAVANSLCLTALDSEGLVGFARVVTDRSTFAYLCDVFVLPRRRGQGLGRALARVAVEHPDTAGVRRFLLATRDAHGVYAPLGFTPIPDPDNLMVIRRDPGELYQRRPDQSDGPAEP